MRKRVLALGTVLGLTLAVLSAVPAHAAFAATITFPNGASEFYSPFSGPATIQITFNGSEPDTTFSVRIRPAGGTSIHTESHFVDADGVSPNTFNFDWPALTVTSPKTYEVVVYNGGTLVANEGFQLKPRLVTITGASPNPFLPWIDDGIKDTTNVHFNLASDAGAEARVFKAKTGGGCCGVQVLTDNLGNLSSGANTWNWDGRDDGHNNLAKGDYYVKIWADDGTLPPAISKPWRVTIARTYLKGSTVEKNGIAYHHTGPVTSYRRGGNCFVTKDETDKDLWITCLSASFTVYWRWAVPAGSKLQKASFVFIKVSSSICNAKKGITRTDSYLKVGGVGQFRCRIDKARATYGVPTAS
jgi:flagellar hook capping protein FlgD